ncbi:hypothetical protein BH09BAC6_BH09BAC6_17510 [soil metagenome]
MKKKLRLNWLSGGFAAAATLIVNMQLAYSQDCNTLFMHKVGAQTELTLYSATHVALGSNVTKVEEMKDDGKLHVIRMSSTHFTNAGVSNSVSNLTYVCNDTVTKIFYDNQAIAQKMYDDLKAMSTAKGGKGFAYSSASDPIEMPLHLKEGMELKPYETLSVMAYTVTEKQWKEVGLPKFTNVNNSLGQYDHTDASRTYVEQLVDLGIGVSTRMVTTNIKVGAMESVTVPAGTFNCYKISKEMYTMTVEKKETGRWVIGTVVKKINGPKQDVYEWFCPGIGTVKQEIHGPDGKIMITSEMTKLSN